MNATTNGRVRKSLAEQIDRLDRTLDGLSEGLNEAVATAVREAVQGVLAELLADAGLRARSRPPSVRRRPLWHPRPPLRLRRGSVPDAAVSGEVSASPSRPSVRPYGASRSRRTTPAAGSATG